MFASEHFPGREQAAGKLLATSDMSAANIVALLPTLTPAANADTSDGKQMLDAMASDNPDLGAGGGNEPDAKAEADSVWTKAYGLNTGVK